MQPKILKDEIIYNGRYLQVKKRHFLARGQKPAVWEMVKRKTYGRIVAIAAITKSEELILEKIFRVPLNDYVLELPAGLRDKKQESEKDCIKRELLEETGYQVKKVELLLKGPFNTGMTADEMAIYFAKNAKLVKTQNLEPEEQIQVIKAPVKNLREFLLNSKIKVDLKIWAVVPFLEKIIYSLNFGDTAD